MPLSKLFHVNGRLYNGDFLNNSMRGFGTASKLALRSSCVSHYYLAKCYERMQVSNYTYRSA
jgi:hypothetical protein